MKLLFWLLQIFNFVLLSLVFVAQGFKNSFHKSGPEVWFYVIMLVTMVTGFILRFAFNQILLGCVVAALPAMILLVWYLIEKASKVKTV